MNSALTGILLAAVLSGCSAAAPRKVRPVVLSEEMALSSSSEEQLLALHNQARNSAGRAPLELDPALSAYAQGWAETMAADGEMKHSKLTFFRGSGYRDAAENVAFNQRSTTRVTQSWLDSTGHRRNILHRSFYHVGFGVAQDTDGRPYWCAVFGG
jgi:uncharacterized protein YkwD